MRAFIIRSGVIMTIDKAIFAFAGIMIILTVALSQYHSTNWLWFTAFVGANLLQSSLTGFCPAAIIFKKLGAKPGVAFD